MIAEAWNVNIVESIHMCQYFQTLAKTSLLLLHFFEAHENAQIVRHIFSTLFFQNLSLFSLRVELITIIICE